MKQLCARAGGQGAAAREVQDGEEQVVLHEAAILGFTCVVNACKSVHTVTSATCACVASTALSSVVAEVKFVKLAHETRAHQCGHCLELVEKIYILSACACDMMSRAKIGKRGLHCTAPMELVHSVYTARFCLHSKEL
jgi:hypothetical protein